MKLRDAKKLVAALITANPAAVALRVMPVEINALARVVVEMTQGYAGVPADMVYDIAEATARKYIKSYLCL